MARNHAATIAALIANAEDETLTDEARASYRAKAVKFMREYRIEEEEAIASESTSAVPVMDSLTIMESGAFSNPMRTHYWQIFSFIAQHCGIRVKGKYTGSRFGEDSKLEAVLVGYEGDIRYAELLWTAARLVFMTRIDARRNPALSDQENCYYMRNSGLKRNEIARALWGSVDNDGTAHGRVQKLYLAECATRNEVPRVSGRGIQVDVYREAYARSFTNEIYWRLDAASSAVDKESGVLILHGRKERVDEAFYAEFPDERPMAMTDEERAAYRAAAQAELDNCAPCKKTTHPSGMCKGHRPIEMTAAQRQRYKRMNHSPEARAGSRAGTAAAQDVHIGRAGTSSPRKAGAADTHRQLS